MIIDNQIIFNMVDMNNDPNFRGYIFLLWQDQPLSTYLLLFI